MLEIFLVFYLSKINKKNALFRGRKSGGFTALTFLLWFGGEILGAFLGAMLAGSLGLFYDDSFFFPIYLVAILFAAVGAVIAYFAAKNCAYGPNRPFGSMALPNAEVSPIPTQINIVRDDNISTPYRLVLNGEEAGKLNRRSYITATTTLVHNIICIRDFFDVPQPFCFTIMPGTLAEIHVMSGRFIPESCVNCYPIDPQAVGQVIAQQQYAQQAARGW